MIENFKPIFVTRIELGVWTEGPLSWVVDFLYMCGLLRYCGRVVLLNDKDSRLIPFKYPLT